MMECQVHANIDYSRVSEIIKGQKSFIVERIKDLSQNSVKHEGKKLEKIAKNFVHKNADGEQ